MGAVVAAGGRTHRVGVDAQVYGLRGVERSDGDQRCAVVEHLQEAARRLAEERNGRHVVKIYLLKSNLGLVPAFQTIWDGVTPVALLNTLSSDRLRFAVDGAHPTGAVHHQKIVAIDDVLAFCGGIDLTIDRWDTSEHLQPNRIRRTLGRSYGPRHEVAVAVDGAAARALGKQARTRWRTATGQRVAEVEALNFAAIAAARHTLYLEDQYLASRPLVNALAARLQEPDGPDIVIVLPRRSEGRLERESMDSARHSLPQLLWEADDHGRLGVYWPVTEDGCPVYVHSKVLVVDDRLLRIGHRT